MRVQLLLACLILFVCITGKVYGQDSTGFINKLLRFPDKIFSGIDKKTAKVEAGLMRQTERYLEKLAKKEQRLQRKVSKLDSTAGKEMLTQSAAKYEELQQKLKNGTGSLSAANNYLGHLDSMQTALKFFDANKLLGQSAGVQQKLAATFGKYQQLQGKFNQAEEIKKYLQERQQYLKQQVEKFGLTKEYRKFQQKVYYYRAQVEEFKNDLNSPTKIESRLLQIANKIPAFQEFFRKNSVLASMFRLPGNDPLPASALAGLQTRGIVMQALQDRFGSGPDFQQQLNQSLTDAQSQLSQLRNRVNQLGGNGNDLDMPDFKPNNQKTKSLWNRIETGINIQSAKSNYFFPVTTDIALSAGYKINDKSIVGIGIAYKMGWGKDIRHISFSHQGIGFRSYADIKLKGNFWISGGAELNYRSEFKDFDMLKNFNPWQRSALLGVTKKYNVGKKWKGKVQLLYDFLAKPGIESPWKLRTGYNF